MAISHQAHAIYVDAMTVACNDLVKNKSLTQARNAFYQDLKNQMIPTGNPKHSREQDILDYFEVHGILELQRKLKRMTNTVHDRIHPEAQHETVNKISVTKQIRGALSVVSDSSDNVKYTPPESDVLTTDKSIPKKISVVTVDSAASCIICRTKFGTVQKLNRHYKKKHTLTATRKLASGEEHRLANIASIEADLKRHRNKEEIREALRKQLASSPLDDLPTYNAEAYRIALRTMTQGEAYRLAKDTARSAALIEMFNQSIASSLETQTSHNAESMLHVTKVSGDVTEHYKPTETGNKLVRQAKEERMQRDALKKQFLQDDVEEKALFSERTVKARSNQAEFAKRVASNFSYKCCITGSTEPLEAAHIEPLSIGDNNNTSNGLLLITCLHRLLDSGKMAINPSSLTVHFSEDCTWFGAKIFDGTRIARPRTLLNIVGLKRLWDTFRAKHM
ncbi:HNH endonuclease [Serratia plymuthica]|uniref:HNH endonuclease n=1 Tax=Serratia plymuthica TaxID=82996 RepID=UPI00390C50F5